MKPVILLLFVALLNTQSSFGQSSVEHVLTSLTEFEKVRDFTISSNGKEAYFTAQSPLEELSVILRVENINGNWQNPQLASFSNGKFGDLEPFLSQDGLKLYFVSNRPLENTDDKLKDYDIWYVTRTTINSNWSAPINMGSPINTKNNEFYPSIANNNNLYFTSDALAKTEKDNIFVSKWINGSYSKPESMSSSINSNGYEFNSFIAPDESYIIFSGYNRKDGIGSGDMYISYKDTANNWQQAINLGDKVNSKSMDYCPFIDYTTNTLYFTSRRSNIKKNSHNNINDFINSINSYENGLSRIYSISLKSIINN
jgi:hypothetical protein